MISQWIGPGSGASATAEKTAASQGAPAAQPALSSSDLKLRLQMIVGPRFEVLEPVALGGMATIIQLRHREHGGLFVAKVLHQELRGRPEVIECFRREAVHAARLGDHPSAVPLLDAGESHGVFFLIMPFIEGEDLDQVLQTNGPMTRSEALHFAAQISSLLCHAESHGITHCDLAPGNIRLDVFGRYRLLDFGISHAADEPAAKFIGGTPLYTSPEQIRGEIPDIRADLYALGLILCEMVTGKPLLEAASLNELRAKHLAGDLPLPDTITADPALTRLIEKLIATDRNQRFSSAFELSGALAALGYERPEFRPRPEGTKPAAPAMRRNRLS